MEKVVRLMDPHALPYWTRAELDPRQDDEGRWHVLSASSLWAGFSLTLPIWPPDFAIREFQEVRMQPAVYREWEHQGLLKA